MTTGTPHAAGGASDADAAEGRVYTVSGEDWDEVVSAADLERLDELDRADEARVISSVSAVRDVASAPREHQRFGIAAEHRGANPS